jgi:hypothetical protein
MKGLRKMENKNSKIFYDTYTKWQLIDKMYDVSRSLLCDYELNGSLTKSSKLSKPEQKLFDDWALMTEILREKIWKECKHNEQTTE